MKMKKLIQELKDALYNDVDSQVHSGAYHITHDASWGIAECVVEIDYYLDLEFRITNDEDGHHEIYDRSVEVRNVRIFFENEETDAGRDDIYKALDETCNDLKI